MTEASVTGYHTRVRSSTLRPALTHTGATTHRPYCGQRGKSPVRFRKTAAVTLTPHARRILIPMLACNSHCGLIVMRVRSMLISGVSVPTLGASPQCAALYTELCMALDQCWEASYHATLLSYIHRSAQSKNPGTHFCLCDPGCPEAPRQRY